MSSTQHFETVHKHIPAHLVYQRALAVCSQRTDLDLSIILSYPLTAISPSIFKIDGLRRTNVKSDLLHCLIKEN